MSRKDRAEAAFRRHAPDAGSLAELARIPDDERITWRPAPPEVAGGGPGAQVLAERLQEELRALGDPKVRVEPLPDYGGRGWSAPIVTIDLSTAGASALDRRLRWQRRRRYAWRLLVLLGKGQRAL